MRLPLLLLLVVLNTIALHSQDCKSYYYFNPEIKTTFTTEDPTGLTTGGKDKMEYALEFTDIKTDSNQCSSKTTYQAPTNKKGTKTLPITRFYIMKGDTLKMPIDNFLGMYSRQQTGGKKDKESENVFLIYPSGMEVGQTFPDVSGKTLGYNLYGGEATVEGIIKNRKVEKKEKITTPAGTWEAFRITFDYTAKFYSEGVYDQRTKSIKQDGGGEFRSKWTEWFVPGFGIIKSEVSMGQGMKMTGIISAVKK